ncbi:nucleotidyltransferase [Bacillus sp. FJAT-45037]|uniref:nucleotidyltransferase n=1 Tax=Bacillus sp. FJAT-45037 TaxID=2011007 RepID=UPI000C241749|nr:nucleotidyltransferase [Bacillus sp. FJAT-45037]
MKSVGVVVEYNPLHNGHSYHINEAKRQTGADVVIAVMSGYFLQRGEPAFVSKWERTAMALDAGVDLVVELPYIYSTQKAQYFAEGAIEVLSSLQVNYLNFGSEVGDIDPFNKLMSFMNQNQDQWDSLVKSYMETGCSYPKATTQAFHQLAPKDTMLSLTEPNNILGYHYMRAICDLRVSMLATTTKRTVAQYHDESVTPESIASATSIRKSITTDKTIDSIQHVVPKNTYTQLVKYKQTYGTYHTWNLYFPLLQYEIIRSTPEQLRNIYECEEGLEYRLKDTITQASNFQEWMTKLKTKRYTWTRLQRLATHILTNTQKDEMNQLMKGPLPYIRLLGMNEKGQSYLSQIKKTLPCPLISRFAKASGPMADVDERVSKIYATPLIPTLGAEILKREFTMTPIRHNHH